MIFELIRPLGVDFLDFIDGLPSQSLGKKTTFFSGKEFDSYSNYQIAIIGVLDNRGLRNGDDVVDVSKIRKALYALYPGNWEQPIIDFGDIVPGESLGDTYYLLRKLMERLLKNQVIPIVIGGSQDLTYAMYRAYDVMEQMVNLVCIDDRLDLVKEDSCPAESFLSRIIMEEPNNLFNYSNLGYQTYFNSQEEIDLIESLYFEAYRLGEIVYDAKISEPVLRDADLVSLDLNAIKSADSGDFKVFNPNGFDGREICSLARYAGLSDRVSAFGMFNYNNSGTEALLIAQVMWYFIEGVNYRSHEYPFTSKKSYFKYIVPIEDYEDLVFYKSDVSGRWWIEVDMASTVNETITRKMLLPCDFSDYESAIAQQVPERWWRALKRGLV